MGLFEALHQTGPGEVGRDTAVVREVGVGVGGWGGRGASAGKKICRRSYLHIKFFEKKKFIVITVSEQRAL